MADITPAQRAMLDAFAQFPVILFRFGTDGVIKQHIGGGLSNFSADREEPLGRNILDYFSFNPSIVAALQRALVGESMSLSGAYEGRYYNVRFEPERLKGELVGVSGIAFDVTQLMDAQTKLEQSEEKFRTLIETSVEGIVMLDVRSTMTFVNQQMAGMLGYSPAELVGRNALEILEPTSKDHIEARQRTRQPGVVEQFEVRYLHKDGHVVPAIVSSRLTTDNFGEITGAVGFITDIRDRKQAEFLQNRLQHALVNAETNEQHRLARALHDGPIQLLAAVNLQLGALRRNNLDRALADDIGNIEDSISETLRSLRLMMFDLEPADPDDVVGAISSCASLLFSNSQTRVQVIGTAPNLDATVANALYRIAREALTNAMKHAAATRVTVSLDELNGGVAMRVQDDGIGIKNGASSPTHSGIRAMGERASEIGGLVQWEPIDPTGTGVFVWLPSTPQAQTQVDPASCP